MPNYDHTCGKCKKDFVVEMKISEVDNKKVSCPECGSKKVERNITNNTFWSESIDRYNYSKTNNDWFRLDSRYSESISNWLTSAILIAPSVQNRRWLVITNIWNLKGFAASSMKLLNIKWRKKSPFMWWVNHLCIRDFIWE